MLQDKQPADDDRELSDADLDKVSGGDSKPVVKPKPKPSTTSSGGGGGLLQLDGIKGESMDDKHKDWIE